MIIYITVGKDCKLKSIILRFLRNFLRQYKIDFQKLFC